MSAGLKDGSSDSSVHVLWCAVLWSTGQQVNSLYIPIQVCSPYGDVGVSSRSGGCGRFHMLSLRSWTAGSSSDKEKMKSLYVSPCTVC